MACHRWIQGPEFIWLPESEWLSKEHSCENITDDDPEVKTKVKVLTTNVQDSESTVNLMISSQSSWFKLKRHTAWFLKLKSLLKELRDIRKSLATQDQKDIEEEIIMGNYEVFDIMYPNT